MSDHLKRLAEDLFASVKGYVARSVATFEARIRAVEERPPAPGPQGEKGADGLPGERGEKGEPGLPGEKGEKGDPGERGADGRDGIDGKDVDLGAWAVMVKDIVAATAGKEIVLPPPLDQDAVARQVFDMALRHLEAVPLPKDGAPGAPGERGADGLNGNDGAPGQKGDPGERGADGAPGKRGADGAPGPQGEKGDPGPSGERGERGEKGEQGPSGEKGDRGDAGERGAPGEKGDPGERGADGAPGAQGEKGEPGERGEKGEPGSAGRDGAPGADGQKGDPGERGEKGDPGIAGKDGANGLDGKSIDPDEVRAEIARLVALLPKAVDGVNGKDGAPGKDGIDGRDGREGIDGRDATAITVLPGIDPGKKYQRGTYAVFRGGEVYAFRATDPIGSEADPEGVHCDLEKCGWQVNRNGEAEFDVSLGEDLRTLTIRRVDTGGRVLSKSVRIPTVIYRGVWKEGEHSRGDQVTWDGGQWTCRVERTLSKPAADNADWQLSTKRGRDGRDGLKGEKGERGAQGRDGKDRPAPPTPL